MKKNSLFKTMLTFMMGAATGMLYAPKEGEELREDLKKGAKKTLNKAKKVKKEECEMIEGVASEVKGKVKDISKVIED